MFAVPDGHGGFARPVKVFAREPEPPAELPPDVARIVQDRGRADSMVLATGPWTSGLIQRAVERSRRLSFQLAGAHPAGRSRACRCSSGI